MKEKNGNIDLTTQAFYPEFKACPYCNGKAGFYRKGRIVGKTKVIFGFAPRDVHDISFADDEFEIKEYGKFYCYDCNHPIKNLKIIEKL